MMRFGVNGDTTGLRTGSIRAQKRILLTPNRWRGLGLICFLVVGIALTGSSAPVLGSTPSGAVAQAVSVNLPQGGSLSLFSPLPSNLTLLSITGAFYNIYNQKVSFASQAINQGGQPLQTTTVGNEIVFLPGNGSSYSIRVNVSAPSTTYVLVFEGTVPSGRLLKNLTDAGVITLDVTMNPAVPEGSSSGWNLTFGFTGISLAGVGLGFTESLALFAAIAVTLVGVGARFSRKLLYLGVMLTLGLGAFLLGLLIVGLVVAAYLGSFVVIRSYYARGAKGTRRQEGAG